MRVEKDTRISEACRQDGAAEREYERALAQALHHRFDSTPGEPLPSSLHRLVDALRRLGRTTE